MAVITHKDGTAAAVLSSNQIKQTEKALQKYEEDNAEAMAQLVTDFTADLQNLQEQIDASITSWFYTSDPSTNTPPASDWTTDQQKADHVGDLYYNKTSGDGWRWQYVSDHYDWVAVTDQKVLDALYAASKSQDTVDSKRRVFYAQPVPPYDRGDLWAQGSQGDILRADVARSASESYTQADWILASKYTDDTAADAAQQTADDAYGLAEDAARSATDFIITDGDGIKVGRNVSSGINYSRMSSGGFSTYANNTELFNAGYGTGNASSGTATAPYYTLGKRKTTTTTYSSSTTYSRGDMVVYNGGLYVYKYSTSSSGNAPTSTIYWQRAIGNYSMAEGSSTVASGYYSHTEGNNTLASAAYSHAEGSTTCAPGLNSHAEGNNTIASGYSSHAGGSYTEAGYDQQTAIGKYNFNRSWNLFEVGNGTSSARSNAFEVSSSGNATVAGTLSANALSVNSFSPSSISTGSISGTSVSCSSVSCTGAVSCSGSLTAGNIAHGYVAGETVSGGSYKDYSVSYGKTFSSTPHVVACFSSTSTASDFGKCTLSVHSTTTTGCKIRFFNGDTSNRAPNFNWIAIG